MCYTEEPDPDAVSDACRATHWKKVRVRTEGKPVRKNKYVFLSNLIIGPSLLPMPEGMNRGLFQDCEQRPIAKGTHLCAYVGKRLELSEVEASSSAYIYEAHVDGEMYGLDGEGYEDRQKGWAVGHLVNNCFKADEADDYNCKLVYVSTRLMHCLVATRNFPLGYIYELYWPYGPNYWLGRHIADIPKLKYRVAYARRHYHVLTSTVKEHRAADYEFVMHMLQEYEDRLAAKRARRLQIMREARDARDLAGGGRHCTLEQRRKKNRKGSLNIMPF